jgi:hypothetical protein
VDVPLARLFVVEPAYEEQFFAEIAKGFEHLPQFHVFALSLRPPFL